MSGYWATQYLSPSPLLATLTAGPPPPAPEAPRRDRDPPAAAPVPPPERPPCPLPTAAPRPTPTALNHHPRLFSLYHFITTSDYIIYLFTCLSSVSSTRRHRHESRALVCLTQWCSRCLAQGLARRRCSINTCWMNEESSRLQRNWYVILNEKVSRTPTHYCPKITESETIISEASYHPLLLWSPQASKGLPLLPKEPERAILDGEKF